MTVRGHGVPGFEEHKGAMSSTQGSATSGHTGVPNGAGKRRGRRPPGQDSRLDLLDAAHAEFTASGYEQATVRAIGRRAGVDPAMVKHWFGGKEQLFAEAVLRLPLDPNSLLDDLLAGDVDTLGERIVCRFLTTWDAREGVYSLHWSSASPAMSSLERC